jgi:hypothetical protein
MSMPGNSERSGPTRIKVFLHMAMALALIVGAITALARASLAYGQERAAARERLLERVPATHVAPAHRLSGARAFAEFAFDHKAFDSNPTIPDGLAGSSARPPGRSRP